MLRTIPVSTYASEDEKKQIKQAAEKADVPLSDFVRHAIAYYMEHGLNIQPIDPSSNKGGARKGAGRKPKGTSVDTKAS